MTLSWMLAVLSYLAHAFSLSHVHTENCVPAIAFTRPSPELRSLTIPENNKTCLIRMTPHLTLIDMDIQ